MLHISVTVCRSTICSIVFLLVCGGTWCSAAEESGAGGTPRTKLLLMGGAERDDNQVLWGEMVRLAGGKGARVAVFPTANIHPERSGAAVASHLRALGLD